MMASKMLSRLLPVAEGDVSMYESMRRHAASQGDLETQRTQDDDDDPENMLYDASIDPAVYRDALSPQTQPSITQSPILERTRQTWRGTNTKRREVDDDDVPESLMLDDKGGRHVDEAPFTARAGIQWQAPSVSQPPQQPPQLQPQPLRSHDSRPAVQPTPSPRAYAEAMWLYTNASNLDAFLLQVYQYYVQHGVWSILLTAVFNQLTELFVFSFAMFLTTCIDYSKIPTSKKTSEVLIPKCMAQASWIKNAALFFFIIYWLTTLANNIRSVRRHFRMHDFYHHVLGINDQDIQTVSWVRVVDGLVRVQNANIETANPPAAVKKYLEYNKPQQRLNAETIANRLMRQANYYVAMYNKDILDFTLPIPFLGERMFYSKSLEWSIDFCLTNFIFDEQGSIRPFCLDVKNRASLVAALRRRLQFAAITSVVLAPWNILRFCIMFFFRYYTEFSRNPARASARTFTPFAEWKIREFNELDHIFDRRLRQAHPFAIEYLKQFPKDKMEQTAKFVAFISGAVAAVLTLATLLDPELFLGFEVTPGRTAVFWLTVMVGIFSVAHGSLPDETEVHDPVLHLREVLMYTHYLPAHWKGKLHSNEVRSEFSSLYQMKVVIFLEEILSLVLAPWILWRNSTMRCERIIDFFREHTVHVEGIGNQCNFAVFGFRKDLNAEDATAVLQEPDGLRDDYYGLKDDKMAASIQNFAQYYSHYNNPRQAGRRQPVWQPPPIWPRMLNDDIAEEQAAEGSLSKSTKTRPDRTGRGTSSSRRRHGPSALRSPQLHSSRAGRSGIVKSSGALQGVTESRLMAQDSDLDDYDKTAGHEWPDSESDGEGKLPGENEGVLGLLYQMHRTRQGGAGVQI